MICSIILYAASAAVLYKLVADYFKTTDPNIRSTFIYSKKYPKMDLFENQIGYAFALEDEVSDEITVDPEKILTYITPYIRVSTDMRNPGSDLIVRKRFYFDFTPCKTVLASTNKKIDKINKVYRDSEFSDFFIESFLCIDFPTTTKEYFVNSNYQLIPNSRIEISIYPCTLPSGCIRDPAKFKHLKLLVAKTGTTFDPENKKSPVAKFVDVDDRYSFDIFQTLEIKAVLKNVLIEDDKIDFRGGVKAFEYIDYDRTAQIRKTRDEGNDKDSICNEAALDDDFPLCEPFFTFEIRSGGLTTKMTREYKHVIPTLSDIGGFFDLATLILTTLLCCCTSRSFGTMLKKEVMGRPS